MQRRRRDTVVTPSSGADRGRARNANAQRASPHPPFRALQLHGDQSDRRVLSPIEHKDPAAPGVKTFATVWDPSLSGGHSLAEHDRIPALRGQQRSRHVDQQNPSGDRRNAGTAVVDLMNHLDDVEAGEQHREAGNNEEHLAAGTDEHEDGEGHRQGNDDRDETGRLDVDPKDLLGRFGVPARLGRRAFAVRIGCASDFGSSFAAGFAHFVVNVRCRRGRLGVMVTTVALDGHSDCEQSRADNEQQRQEPRRAEEGVAGHGSVRVRVAAMVTGIDRAGDAAHVG